MKNICITIKAIVLILLGACIFGIMAFATFVNALVSSIKQVKFKKSDE